jgi:nucleoid-associated protein YgaU
MACENDRFLLETSRSLAVGDYLIHADSVGADGKLISRVTVPFTREAGEAVTAVAAPEAQKPEAAVPSAGDAAAAAQPAKEPEQASVQAEPAPAKAAEAAAAGPEPAKAAPAAAAGPAAVAKAAEPSSETVAPALTKVDASVIIRRGDSLWRISRRVYGRGVRYSTIYLANKEKVRNPNRIWPGQVMMIPEKTSEGEAANMAEIEKRKKDAQSQ